MRINLKAYRFSESELKKLIDLRQLFSENNLVTDRFPEIYYDDIENYEHLFGKFKATNEDTADYLGVYHYGCEPDELTTKEGIIVLFKDRIENFCKRKPVDLIDVRYIVLMHEMGHWLTHWSKSDGANWEKGYGIDNPMTHEALAQLIAYWMVDGNPNCEKILRGPLTPEDKNNEYAHYLNLTGKSKSDVLLKLIEIRKYFSLSDFFLSGFMQSNSGLMNDFISGLFLRETLHKMDLGQIEKSQPPIKRVSDDHEQLFCDSLIESLKKMINSNSPPVPYWEQNILDKTKIDAILSKLFFDQKCINKVVELLYRNRGKITGTKFGIGNV
jgi:hypothetical protein